VDLNEMLRVPVPPILLFHNVRGASWCMRGRGIKPGCKSTPPFTIPLLLPPAPIFPLPCPQGLPGSHFATEPAIICFAVAVVLIFPSIALKTMPALDIFLFFSLWKEGERKEEGRRFTPSTERESQSRHFRQGGVHRSHDFDRPPHPTHHDLSFYAPNLWFNL
jgi:hypothetical protein